MTKECRPNLKFENLERRIVFDASIETAPDDNVQQPDYMKGIATDINQDHFDTSRGQLYSEGVQADEMYKEQVYASTPGMANSFAADPGDWRPVDMGEQGSAGSAQEHFDAFFYKEGNSGDPDALVGARFDAAHGSLHMTGYDAGLNMQDSVVMQLHDDGSGSVTEYDANYNVTAETEVNAEGHAVKSTETQYNEDGVPTERNVYEQMLQPSDKEVYEDVDQSSDKEAYEQIERSEHGDQEVYQEITASSHQRTEFDSEGGEATQTTTWFGGDGHPIKAEMHSNVDGEWQIDHQVEFDGDGDPSRVTDFERTDDGVFASTSVLDKDGNEVMHMQYDQHGHTSQFSEIDRDMDGNPTQARTYDGYGHLLKEVEFDQDGEVAGERTYDPADNYRFDPDEYAHYGDDREVLSTTVQGDEESGERTVTEYDVSENKLTESHYDDKGQLESKAYFDKQGDFHHSEAYTYHDNGEMKSLTIMSVDRPLQVTEFDQDGQVVSKTTSTFENGAKWDVKADGNGNTVWKGMFNTANELVKEVVYDADGNPQQS
jgi:hypothetical protein